MANDKLIVVIDDFTIEVLVCQKGKISDGDLCYDCLMKALTVKPKRKYERKEQPGPVKTAPPPPESTGLKATTTETKTAHPPETPPTSDPLDGFQLRVGLDAGQLNTVTYRGNEYQSESLFGVVCMALIGKPNRGEALELVNTFPASNNKKIVLNILEQKE
jgi:hypothetical protein